MASKNQADAAEDLVRRYLREIGGYELLTSAEEVALAKAIEAGKRAAAELARSRSLRPGRRQELEALAAQGRHATQRFIQANLRLVVSIAKRYQQSGVPLL